MKQLKKLLVVGASLLFAPVVFGQDLLEATACQQVEEQLYLQTILKNQQSVSAYLDSLRACGQEDVYALMGVAKYLFKVNEILKADHLFQRIRNQEAESETLWAEIAFYRGYIAKQLKLYDESMVFFDESFKAGYHQHEVMNAIGELMLEVGREEDAKTLFLEILKSDPNHVSSHFNLGVIYRSNYLYQPALAHLMMMDSLTDGNMLKGQIELIVTLRSLNKYAEAMAKAQALVVNFPTSREALYELGSTTAYLGQHEQAIEIIERLKRYGLHTSNDFFEVGYIFDCAGMEDSAAVYYAVCIKLDPKSVAALTNLGTIYKQMGEFERAQANFDQALEQDPKNRYALNMKAQTYIWQHDYPKSLAWTIKMDSIYPDHHGYYLMRGYLLLLLEKYEEAIPWLQKQIVYIETDNRAWNNLGACYTGLGQYEEAEAHFNKALALDANNSFTYHNRALLYQKQGFHDRACEDLQKAIDLEYNWLIDPALADMQQQYCPEVNMNRKINIYIYKGNSQSKKHLTFIDVVDSLSVETYASIPAQVTPGKNAPVFKNDLSQTHAVVFPNPSTGQITVRHGFSGEYKQLKVFNQNGVLMFSSMMSGPVAQFDLGHLGEGVYVLLLIANEGIVSSQKLILL